jgi:hypothetical protein
MTEESSHDVFISVGVIKPLLTQHVCVCVRVCVCVFISVGVIKPLTKHLQVRAQLLDDCQQTPPPQTLMHLARASTI